MEEITQAAKAVYHNFSETEKTSWEEMFRTMDKNKDGKVSLQEYVNSKGEGDPNMVKPQIFKLVDRRNDGNLQMEEFYTLCYIIASGRPTCRGRGCGGDCITSLFFTCTTCRFDNAVRDNFDLCISCYQKKAFEHDHAEFVDNYMLLADMQQKLSSGELQYRNTTQPILSSGSPGADQLVEGALKNITDGLSLGESHSASFVSSSIAEGTTMAFETYGVQSPSRRSRTGSRREMFKKVFGTFGAMASVGTKIANAFSSYP